MKLFPLIVMLVALTGCATLPEVPNAPAASGRGAAASDNPPADAHGQAANSPAGLVLGEGDVIKFNMFGQPNLTTQSFVSTRGDVSLPLVDTVHIGGLTPSQAEARIAAAYREGGYFKKPQVNVTLVQYRSHQLSVLGEVNKPGRYPLKTQTTLLEALAQAQGEKPRGSHVVTVIHKTAHGTRRQRVNLDSLVTGVNNRSITLVAGDIVYVPRAQQFYIYGQVQRPNAYPIRPGMTVRQAIAVGGGLTDKGSDSRIVVSRKTADGIRRFAIDPSDKIQPDDVILVKERFF